MTVCLSNGLTMIEWYLKRKRIKRKISERPVELHRLGGVYSTAGVLFRVPRQAGEQREQGDRSGVPGVRILPKLLSLKSD